MEDTMLVYKYDQIMESQKWRNEIPYLQFPIDYKVKIIPPFGGAVVRFLIEKNGKKVSVYLDCYNKLGCYGEPYWEIYPHEEDVFRCDMNDTDSLMKAIEQSLSADVLLIE